eukprot:c8568_g1_i1 orf=117-1277(+)
MGLLQVIVVVLVAVVMSKGVVAEEEIVVKGCRAPLVVMGASMVDVGENAVAQPLTSAAEFVPYGVDFFQAPAARWSNGRVISDFISQGLGYGLMEPYLNSVNPQFANGVNFASSGSTARNSTQSGSSTRGSGLFPLDVQVRQYKQFKAKVQSVQAKHQDKLTHLPTPMRLERAIHIMMQAHNDYSNTIFGPSYDPLTVVTSVVAAIEDSLRVLYSMGARTMIVMNVLPLGCTPSFLAYALTTSKELNNDSCVASDNSLVDLHNSHLQTLIQNLRVELSWDELVVFDLNAVYMDAVRHPSKYGVTSPMKACCGAGGGKYNLDLSIACGRKGTLNGVAVEAGRCANPTEYISWDGLHPTESFAKHIAYALLRGQYFSPSLSMNDACKA